MPRTKLDAPKGPPVDWNLAIILERKKALRLEWADIAAKAGMSPEALRGMVSRKPTEEWPVYTLRKVMRALGMEYRGYVVGSPEDRDRE